MHGQSNRQALIEYIESAYQDNIISLTFNVESNFRNKVLPQAYSFQPNGDRSDSCCTSLWFGSPTLADSEVAGVEGPAGQEGGRPQATLSPV